MALSSPSGGPNPVLQGAAAHHISQLKDQSNALKTTALEEGKAISEMIKTRVGELEDAHKAWRPGTKLGRIFKPLMKGGGVKANKLLLKEIVVLQRDLTKTEDATQIEKLSLNILTKINKFKDINKQYQTGTFEEIKGEIGAHVSKLSKKIDEVQTSYTTELPMALKDVRKKIADINVRLKPFGIDAQAKHIPATTLKKMQNLEKSITKMESKGHSSSNLQPLAEIDRELAKIEDVQEITKNSAGSIRTSRLTAQELLAEVQVPGLPEGALGQLQKEINAKINILNGEYTVVHDGTVRNKSVLTLKQATKLADIREDLSKLRQEFTNVKAEYEAAKKAIENLSSDNFIADKRGLKDSFENISAPAGGVSADIARRNLENIKRELGKRETDIEASNAKSIKKAKTASDFKKIADSCNRLIADTKTANKLGVELKKAIDEHSTIWSAKTGENGDLNVLTGPAEEVAAKQRLIALYDKKAALLKDVAKKDLNSYITSLNQMNRDIETFTKDKFTK